MWYSLHWHVGLPVVASRTHLPLLQPVDETTVVPLPRLLADPLSAPQTNTAQLPS